MPVAAGTVECWREVQESFAFLVFPGVSVWEWLTLAGLCLAGAASPGPSLAVVMGASLRGGRGAGLAAAWAHAAGVGLYAALTVLGIGALITSHEIVFQSLQIAGAAYLLWLARRLWLSGRAAGASAEAPPEPILAGTGQSLRDGFAIAFLNPKLAVFMLALFSQFIKPDAGVPLGILLVATAALIDGFWYSLIALAVTRAGWVGRLRDNAALIDRSFAVLLALLANYIIARSYGLFGL
ncbi:MAG: threonine/homoserine/homoserine lactone efflux protein [Halieaceae bacterium]|jgi:threonine/homoserine/homoserine lactone efflux protein